MQARGGMNEAYVSDKAIAGHQGRRVYRAQPFPPYSSAPSPFLVTILSLILKRYRALYQYHQTAQTFLSRCTHRHGGTDGTKNKILIDAE